MNIKKDVTRVDDYSGNLTRNLAVLEMAQENGAVDQNKQLDFLSEVQQAAFRKNLRPWRARSIWAVFIGLGLLVLSGLMACLLPGYYESTRILALLAILPLGIGGGCYMAYSKRRKSSNAWFRGLEDSIRGGASLFDLW